MNTVSNPLGQHHQGCNREAIATRLAALAHPARLKILQHVAGAQACCCKEVVQQLDLAQSTVSQHLKVLVDAGLVRLTPESRRSRYEVDCDALRDLAQSVNGLLNSCCGGPTHGASD